MKKIFALAGILLLSGSIFFPPLQAAVPEFQVTFLPGPDEPRRRPTMTPEAFGTLFARRLSESLKRKIEFVSFEKANAKTIFLMTREGALGGEYAKILAGKPKDSFIIRYPVTVKGKKNVCLLMSRDAWGYYFPANWFLREFVGFDIVGLTDYGYVYPENGEKWQMPKKISVTESPSFHTRRWTMNSAIDKEIQRMYMGESGRNIAWHALGRILDPRKYGRKHPEYYPLINGKRFNNPRKQRVDWQPCLGNPDVQKILVDHVLKNYGKDDADGVSLAVNDGGGRHCECKLCTAPEVPKPAGKYNYSDRYFYFYGKILDQARKVNPEAKIIILLYADCTLNVPAIKIHPGIIGMGTNRADFAGFAKQGLKRMGLWDHHLDRSYPLVRHFPKSLAAKLRRLHKLGLSEYFGEVYTIHAANGPKQYILGRLLWNVNYDVDKAMMEYCTKAFGKGAAPHVKAYYDVWETVYERDRASGRKRNPNAPFTFSIDRFEGLRQGDTDKMAEALKKAAAAAKSDVQKKRLQDVINHFEYTRCLADRYLISQRLRSEKLSLDEINALRQKCAGLDVKFDTMWKNIVSKDNRGVYRYLHRSRKDVNTIYHNYRDTVTGYVLESTLLALENHARIHCKGMKRKARVDYWNKAQVKYPEMVEISSIISKMTGKAVKNYLRNSNFKKYKPGNPDVLGAHPQLDEWFFYEQIGQVQSDEYKSLWRIVPSKAAFNHLAIGQGKYPEIRQYVKLTKGAYRFSFSCRPNNLLRFSFYEIPGSKELKSVPEVRKLPFRTPEFISFNCHKAAGVVKFSRMIVVPSDNWYALLIASPNTKPGTWSRLWGLKLEKLN